LRKTIYDIAKEAKVSPATVSRVMNSKGYVSEETRKLVMSVAQGYEARRRGPSIKRKTSRTIGLVIAHSSSYFFFNPTYTSIMSGISDVAKQHGYMLMLDIQDSDSATIDIYISEKVDGFILLGARKSSRLIPRLLLMDIPFVLIGDYLPDEDTKPFCKVDIDDFAAARNVTRYLLDLGHRHIGFISGSFEYASCFSRYRGYAMALEEAGIPLNPDYIASSEGITQETAYHLAKTLLFLKDRPTAIISFNDAVSIAVYRAAHDCGYSIPGDLSVIGFDDCDFARYAAPPLTTVWQPSLEKGYRAAEILIQGLLNPPIEKSSLTFSSVLIYRDSCAPPRN
jgi:LacI family transcriptional regulator